MLNCIGISKVCLCVFLGLSALVFSAQANNAQIGTEIVAREVPRGQLILRKSDVEVPPELIREMSFLMMVSSDSQTSVSARFGADLFQLTLEEETKSQSASGLAPVASITRFPLQSLSVKGMSDGYAVFHHPQTNRFYAWLNEQPRDLRYVMSDQEVGSSGVDSDAQDSSPRTTGALFLLELDWVAKDQGLI